MSQTDNLTQEELLHLAVEATRRGEHGASISYLKEGVSRFPEDAKLAYVLGAEFAQIGLYDQAEAEMQRAISLDAELYTAIFQLGLLQMTLGKVEEAKSSWSQLDTLSTDHALWLFKTGLEHLAANDFENAQEHLKKGLEVNDFSPELNNDMQTVLDSIPQEDAQAEEDSTEEAGDDSVANQARLNAYTSNSD